MPPPTKVGFGVSGRVNVMLEMGFAINYAHIDFDDTGEGEVVFGGVAGVRFQVPRRDVGRSATQFTKRVR
jgi:hypothetical protein